MSSTKISVIIPTYNRLNFLKTCLTSLENQRYDKAHFEVIVINDGSTDSTGKFLSDFKKTTLLDFSFITHHNRGVSYSRNVGIQAARGLYIAFTDDDCILPDNWLLKMDGLFSLQDDSVAGIGGPLNSVTIGMSSYFTQFIQFLDEFNYIPVISKYFVRAVHVSGLTGQEKIAYLRTSNAIFRAKCLRDIGGFDISFKRPGGEDPDICYRIMNLNYRFLFNKELVVSHQSRESVSAYFRSLKNYLDGETKKSRKKHLYNCRAIQRTYTFIPLQKVASFLLASFNYPWQICHLLWRQEFTTYQIISFPLLLVASKAYAVFFSCFFYMKYLNKNAS